MIIVRLKGGLGNQLFQYGLASYFSVRDNSNILIDTSWFKSQELREEELKHFKTTSTYLPIFFSKYLLKEGSTPYKIIKDVFSIKDLKENHFHYNQDIVKVSGNISLEGYWQSFRYIESNRELLLKEIVPKTRWQDKCSSLINSINKSNSVSIHIRRGDYLSNPISFNYHGIVEIDYIKKAVQCINNEIRDPKYFIFTDDIEWAKNNLGDLQNGEIVSGRNLTSVEELMLMKNCKHNIIANSSFSWWGAWLNENPDKIVIRPEKWFNDPSIDTKDLCPPSWIKL